MWSIATCRDELVYISSPLSYVNLAVYVAFLVITKVSEWVLCTLIFGWRPDCCPCQLVVAARCRLVVAARCRLVVAAQSQRNASRRLSKLQDFAGGNGALAQDGGGIAQAAHDRGRHTQRGGASVQREVDLVHDAYLELPALCGS